MAPTLERPSVADSGGVMRGLLFQTHLPACALLFRAVWSSLSAIRR